MASKRKRTRGNADPDEYQVALAKLPAVDTSSPPFQLPPEPKPN